MASSLEMMGMMRGAQAGMQIGDAYKAKLNAEMQATAIDMQMEEIDRRSDMAVRDIQKQGERVQSEQIAAYIKGGVALEGSAMEVIADTLMDATEAAMIAKRQADYDKIGLAGNRAALEEQASNLNFILNSVAGAGSAYAAYKSDEFNYNRGSMRNRGSGAPSGFTYAGTYSRGNASGIV